MFFFFFFIRIKLTRVHKNIPMAKGEGGIGKNTSLATKVSVIFFTNWTNSKCNELKELYKNIEKCYHSYGWKMLKFSQLFQTSNESKKRKQAKKLVEKARVIQQSKKAAAEEKGTLRRSSRGKASIKKSYCEDEVQFKGPQNNTDFYS